jgi:hypothetical protein
MPYAIQHNYSEINALHIFDFIGSTQIVFIKKKKRLLFEGKASDLMQKDENANIRDKLEKSKLVSITADGTDALAMEIDKAVSGTRVRL